MKTIKTISLVMALMLISLFLYNCSGSSVETGNENSTIPDADDSVGLANPASTYCEEQGGTLEIRTDADGNQYGVCVFDDGSECEEWAFFRGECQPGNSDNSPSSDDLIDIIWTQADSPITIEFTTDGQVSGQASCNSYFGSYTLDGGSLISGPVGSTEMWCEGLMEQETAFLQKLQAATGLTVAENRLTIHTPDGDMVFAPAENAVLEDIRWTLSGITQGDAVVSTWVDEDIAITFTAGQVSGYAGCNNFSGSYQIDGDNLTLSGLMNTMKTCKDDVNQREAEFLAALGTVTQFRVEINQLILSNAKGQDVIFFTAESL